MQNRSIIIGAGAVVFRGGDVLLVRRGKEPFAGRWSIPGGRLRFGERIGAAIRREVREETGVEIALQGLAGVFEATPDIAEGAHFLFVDYWATWISGEPRAGDDAAAAEFAPLDEALRRVSWDETRRAIEAAAKLRDTVINRP